MVDIFKEAEEKVMPEWAKFTNPGDSVQGTYVGKIVGQKSPAFQQEQIVYQLLQDDGKIINVAFGLNKKVLHQDMEAVSFGQIVGFRYKGTIQVKNRATGMMVNVKDYALHQDPKIVNETWLKENEGDMPKVVKATNTNVARESAESLAAELGEDDVPFSSAGSLTNEDKLAVIEKLAKDKLGATTPQDVKVKVMESTGIAFIAVRYQEIIDKLVAL